MNNNTESGGASIQPHSVEAEQLVLGTLLINNDAYHKISGVLRLEHFYDPVHAAIYGEIQGRIDAGKLASPVTLSRTFNEHEGAKELGGAKYLARLAGAATATFAIVDYAEMVVDLADRRGILEIVDECRESILTDRQSAVEIAIDVETRCGAVATQSSNKPLVQSHLAVLTSTINEINDVYQGTGDVGVSTGLPQLDKILTGFRAGQLIIVGGRPGMGKTTGGQNFAYHAAANGIGVFFGNLEMPAEELGRRFLARGLADQGVRIPYSRMTRKDAISEQDFRRIIEEAKRQEALPIITGERDVRHVDRLRAAVKRAHQRFADSGTPLGLVVVDYLQLVQSKYERAYDRASAASDTLKSLSLELGVPVVVAAQLNRSVELRDPPRPMLSDLRESGKLEEDADVVMFFYREEYYLRSKVKACRDIEERADLEARLHAVSGLLEIIIEKQRNGPTGSVDAFADLPTCSITADRSTMQEELI